MLESKLNLGAVAIGKAAYLQLLIDKLNNTTVGDLSDKIDSNNVNITCLQNIDDEVLKNSPNSLPLIFLLKAMRDDISLLQSDSIDTIRQKRKYKAEIFGIKLL